MSNNKAQFAGGLVSLVIGVIVIFTVISATYSTVEDSAMDLEDEMNSSSVAGVVSISSLPGTAVLLFMLSVVMGIILIATRGL